MNKRLDKKKFFYDSFIGNWIRFAKWIPGAIPKGWKELKQSFNSNLIELVLGIGLIGGYFGGVILFLIAVLGVITFRYPYIAIPIEIVFAYTCSFLSSGNQYYLRKDYIIEMKSERDINKDEEIRRKKLIEENRISDEVERQLRFLNAKVQSLTNRLFEEQLKTKELEEKNKKKEEEKEIIKNIPNGSLRIMKRL